MSQALIAAWRFGWTETLCVGNAWERVLSNFIMQKPLSDKTRINGNLGYLFAGNTSTGVLGIQRARGHVYTGGLSLLHDSTCLRSGRLQLRPYRRRGPEHLLSPWLRAQGCRTG